MLQEREALRRDSEIYLSPQLYGDIRRELTDRQTGKGAASVDGPSSEVRDARREAAVSFLRQFMGRRKEPYQLEVEGVDPTLMALRSDVLLVPEDRYAAGEAGVGWLYGGQPAVNAEQLSIDFNAPPAVNTVKAFERQAQVEQALGEVAVQQEAVRVAQKAKGKTGALGRRMAMRYGVPTLGALLGVYGLASLTGQPREEERRT